MKNKKSANHLLVGISRMYLFWKEKKKIIVFWSYTGNFSNISVSTTSYWRYSAATKNRFKML